MRDSITIEEDRAKAAELFKRGYRDYTEIARVINSSRSANHVTGQTVRQDIERYKQSLREKGFKDFARTLPELIDELDDLKAETWKSFYLSKQPKISIESEHIVDESQYADLKLMGMRLNPNEKHILRDAKVREELRPEGNHAFLQMIFQIQDKQIKMMGEDAPSKPRLTDPDEQGQIESPLDDILEDLKSLSDGEVKLLNEAETK